MVCRGIYRLNAPRARDARQSDAPEVDIQVRLAARLAAMGLDLSRYKNKRFAERGLDPAERLTRGPLMLVGEAAGIDAASGEGIAQAIELGALAGRFLARTQDVSAWHQEVTGSRVARDLRIRNRFSPLYYGPDRRRVEHLLFGSADFVHVGCQHFAAVPYDRLRLARIAARAGAVLAVSGLGRALARLPRARSLPVG